MNKIITLLLSCVAALSFAQQIEKPPVYSEGDHHFQLGLGYPNLAGIAVTSLNALSQYTNTEEPGKSIPQITFSYDYAIDQKLSLGAYIGFSQATTPKFSAGNVLKNDYDDYLRGIDVQGFLNQYFNGASDIGNFDITEDIQYRLRSFSFGGRGLTHFHRSEKVDLYGRGSIGFSINKVKNIAAGGDGSTLDVSATIPVPKISLGGHFGLRYFFNENWGAYGEVGYSTTDILQVGASYRILKKAEKAN